jgi:parallel beta-helix repeat protein
MSAMLGKCFPCLGKQTGAKYAVDEIAVPGQCATLWQALQRCIASNGRVKMIRVDEGDYEMGKESIVIDVSMVHIKGAGRGLTRFHRNDNIAKFQVSGGARNVFLEGLSMFGMGAGDGVVVLGGASLRLDDVEISKVGGFGVHVGAAGNCEIIECEISNNGCPGVWVDGKDSFCFVRNTNIHSNNSDGCFAVNGGHCVLNGAVKVHGNTGFGIGAEGNGTLTIRTNEKLGFAVRNNKGASQRKEADGGRIIIDPPSKVTTIYTHYSYP